MKPVHNFHYCPECRKNKILFESEKAANNFMKFNAAEIEAETGKAPVRAYYCQACAGWHVTSSPVPTREQVTRTDRVIEEMDKSRKTSFKVSLLRQSVHGDFVELQRRADKLALKLMYNVELVNEEVTDELLADLNNHVEAMGASVPRKARSHYMALPELQKLVKCFQEGWKAEGISFSLTDAQTNEWENLKVIFSEPLEEK